MAGAQSAPAGAAPVASSEAVGSPAAAGFGVGRRMVVAQGVVDLEPVEPEFVVRGQLRLPPGPRSALPMERA